MRSFLIHFVNGFFDIEAFELATKYIVASLFNAHQLLAKNFALIEDRFHFVFRILLLHFEQLLNDLIPVDQVDADLVVESRFWLQNKIEHLGYLLCDEGNRPLKKSKAVGEIERMTAFLYLLHFDDVFLTYRTFTSISRIAPLLL